MGTARDTSIQSFQYKILHRTLPCNQWLNNIKINSEKTCSYCNEIDTITHFLIECKSNKYFWKGWSRWWHCITGFNLRRKDYTYEYILFGFPGKSDSTIVANYCILYTKQYIYLEKHICTWRTTFILEITHVQPTKRNTTVGNKYFNTYSSNKCERGALGEKIKYHINFITLMICDKSSVYLGCKS